jgi:hypothetical protein
MSNYIIACKKPSIKHHFFQITVTDGNGGLEISQKPSTSTCGRTCPSLVLTKGKKIPIRPRFKVTYFVQTAFCNFFSPLSITFSLHDEDLRVVNKTVGNSCGYSCSVKNCPPFCERQVGRNDSRFFFMPGADDLEE